MLIRGVIIVILTSLVFISCKEDERERYEGIWEGPYTGDLSGSWKIRIDDDGTSEGVARPVDSDNQSFVFRGAVNEEGELTMSATVFNRVVIYEAYLTERELSGSWYSEEGNFEGTWSGSKREQDEQFPYGLILNP